MRVIIALAVVAVVIGYAVLSGVWVSSSPGWYQSLEQPSWQPPPWVFGLIWPYNFLALIVVGIAMATGAPVARAWAYLGLLVLTAGLAVGWAYLFYVPHALTIAAVVLSAAAVLTLPLTALAFMGLSVIGRGWLGLLLIPYQVWLILAASLSWAYALNPSPGNAPLS